MLYQFYADDFYADKMLSKIAMQFKNDIIWVLYRNNINEKKNNNKILRKYSPCFLKNG